MLRRGILQGGANLKAKWESVKVVDDGKEAVEKPDRSAAKPTLKTIAALAGLAVPTVSRALSDAPDIGAQTKLKVRRIAEEIGYVPNRAGVRLRTGRTNVVSLVLPTEHDVMNHTGNMISSIASALRDTRFHLNVTPVFTDEDDMRAVRYIVETGSADAIILNRISPDDRRVAYLMDRGFPVVTHGRTNWGNAHPWFDYDNRAYGREAMRALKARGRRNLLMIAPPLDQTYAQHMSEAAEAESGAGVRLRYGGKLTSEAPPDEMIDGVTRILKADPGIDGLICSSASNVLMVVSAAEALGRTIGRDIDVAGKETMPLLEAIRPGLITFHEDITKAGAFMARAAVQAVTDPELPPMHGLEIPGPHGQPGTFEE